MTQTFYHGSCSNAAVEDCREALPSLEHGNVWTPTKMTKNTNPYIVDNGAWSAYVTGEKWDFNAWLDLLEDVEDMPREPDFVVLPDVVGNADATYRRATTFLDYVTRKDRDWDPYFAVQDGMNVEEAVRFAKRNVGATGIFVGGSTEWKRKHASQFRMTAHGYGLKCHLARPGIDNLLETIEAGFDSLDTTTIVANGDYDKLRRIERMLTNGTEQTRLEP